MQMNPSLLPKIKGENKYSSFEVQEKSCPEGMVPILKSKVAYNVKDSNSISRVHLENIHPLTQTRPGSNFAGFKMKGDSTIYGAHAAITVHNPSVEKDQLSMSLITIEKGPPDDLNFIQAGWAVHPLIYGDNNTHITGYWTVSTGQTTGCYNLFCPGFVQVNPVYYLGQVIKGISIVGGNFYDTKHSIFLDQQTGNWWLLVDTYKIGYWPKELFTHLNGGAEYIQYGGWTYNSPDSQLSPPMGIGLFPGGEINRNSSFFTYIQVAYKFNDFIDINGHKVERIVDNYTCYNAKYLGRQAGFFRETFSYGGPGGLCSGI
ncbi:hypothetical protein Ddye_027927 [Dipteronia dyeriana]|uniref:Neprosin PEP catalytic domain-containing protein n=1 Tax=Dipteronia dyeriana TaxID=168575 RepID=A0AAD9TQ25_9ROSI|nr:hypothetical protein Ddye_027927 [Dipteronia dyeriana]